MVVHLPAGTPDDVIHEKRCRLKESVYLATGIPRVGFKYQMFIDGILEADAKTDKTVDPPRPEVSSVFREMDLYRLDIEKGRFIVEANNREAQDFERMRARVVQQNEEIQEQIRAHKEELAEEQQIRKCKEEYEAVAREVNKLPSKAATCKQIAEVEELRRGLAEQMAQVATLTARRTDQLRALLRCMEDLRSDIVLERQDMQVDEEEAAPPDEGEPEQDADEEDTAAAKKARRRHAADLVAAPARVEVDEDDPAEADAGGDAMAIEA